MSDPTIVWLRQDLRLSDHPAFGWASERGGPVVQMHQRGLGGGGGGEAEEVEGVGGGVRG